MNSAVTLPGRDLLVPCSARLFAARAVTIWPQPVRPASQQRASSGKLIAVLDTRHELQGTEINKRDCTGQHERMTARNPGRAASEAQRTVETRRFIQKADAIAQRLPKMDPRTVGVGRRGMPLWCPHPPARSLIDKANRLSEYTQAEGGTLSLTNGQSVI